MRAEAISRCSVVALTLLSALPSTISCAEIQAEGSFDGVPFQPDQTVLAVVDQTDVVVLDGTPVAVLRNAGEERLTLLLSGAFAVPGDDWLRLDSAARLELKHRLATSDGIFLENIPLAEAAGGEPLSVPLGEEGRVGQGAFAAYLVIGRPEREDVAAQGLGSRVEVELRLDPMPADDQSRISGEVEIKRGRGDAQEGEVATGSVTLRFSAAPVPERRGESNLQLARPVVLCAAEAGPVRAGRCRSEGDAVDEAQTLKPRE